MISFQEFSHFLFREAKLLVKTGICNGKYLKIVQASKNALLGNAQTACQNSKLQKSICLQCLSEQAADERHHFSVIAMLESLVQRYIVLIDQNDRFLAIMFIQQFR